MDEDAREGEEQESKAKQSKAKGNCTKAKKRKMGKYSIVEAYVARTSEPMSAPTLYVLRSLLDFLLLYYLLHCQTIVAPLLT